MGADIKLQKEALAWIAKNAGKGKYANLDGSRIAVAGQSCGGLESYYASQDPAVKTIGIFNSGFFTSTSKKDMEIVTKMNRPIFYFLGGKTDIAFENGEANYKVLPSTTPAWKGNLPVGHMATYTQAKGGKFGTAMWKWLDFTLRGGNSSSEFFAGKGAENDGWSVEKRNMDKISVTPIG
ncbi:hypothetical protein BT63DRAFT_448332 [Microthyrium microscopicum]|uniref:Alpha/beta-hydrolase n=1 Tax=Microthyrium microscopicum TaxID=703497 RepID=A0A6A6U022_9PEZI|nr:hypothetical protein BT63DRAFT_448332 [Microthyrium microscopicum]